MTFLALILNLATLVVLLAVFWRVAKFQAMLEDALAQTKANAVTSERERSSEAARVHAAEKGMSAEDRDATTIK